MLHWFASRLRETSKDERGFTLIELLVVVIIIGILAAIAIPVFLNQRRDAQDAAVKADLRTAATAQQTRVAAGLGYSTDANGLTDYGYRPSDNVGLQFDPAPGAAEGGYCMYADWESTGRNYQISEADTKPESGNCS